MVTCNARESKAAIRVTFLFTEIPNDEFSGQIKNPRIEMEKEKKKRERKR